MLINRDPYPDTLGDDEREERQKLLADMSRPVLTIEAVRMLKRRQREWLLRHPDDYRVLEEGEGLLMLESALKMKS